MKDVVRESIERTPVGGTGSIRPPSQSLEVLTGFQAAVLEAERLSSAGAIVINEKHRESWSGHRLIDRMMFVRLR